MEINGLKMKITIECHGAARNWCGADELSLDLPETANVAAALDALATRYPDFAAQRTRVAVASGDTVVRGSAPLREGERLALIPPVSGG